MGRKVLLLEREQFPRHHIGESMIAASLDVLAEIGLEEKLAAADFPVKSGGCFFWGESRLPWCIRFDEIPGRPTSYQVKRSVFDKILLDHCESLGVDVRQRHRVTEVLLGDGRVTGVRFEGPDGAVHEAEAAYTVDASGLNAVVANKLSRRLPVEELKNIALYGYWQGEHPAPAKLGGEIRPTDRNNILAKMLDDGWLWFIPLGNGLISVGFVAPQVNVADKGGKAGLEEHYLEKVRSTPEWEYLLGNSEYTGEFHTIKDWSYRSDVMAGPGYFAVGDAACFVDPILSSGAYLAILYAKMAAIGINTLIDEPSREALVQEWYQGLYLDTYTDYLEMARFWYHDIRRVDAWFDKAHDKLDEEEGSEFVDTDRASFIGLATGNAHAHPNYVLLRQLDSFPLPIHLRKDPRGHYMKEARVALFGRARGDDAAPEEFRDEAERSARMMAASPRRRRMILDALRDDAVEVVTRLSDVGGVSSPTGRLAVSDEARFSLEPIDDIVTMIVRAPNGERRVLSLDEERLVAAVPQHPAGSLAAETGLDQEHVDEFSAELLAAGVFVSADS